MAALGTLSSAWTAEAAVTTPAPQEVVPGTWLIPGGMRPNREPDGNTVVFDAPAGLVVVDTARHSWQQDAILSLARARNRPIVAIVNTHWHLDHVSGNPVLRAAYPGLRVYASNAIDAALDGFLAASARDAASYLDDPQVPEETREDIRGDLATTRNGAALKPDVVIETSGAVTLGGRMLNVNLAPNAATAGDVWLYDAKDNLAVLGDLVTLPAPFLDTACPDGWKAALAQVAATPFKIAIPGHGAPMNHDQFALYRKAFEDFIDCAKTADPAEQCSTHWAESIGALLSGDPLEKQRAQKIATYYVGLLRANGGRSKYCEAPRRPPLS
jgi:glyoxylase-like metal-dependent hydrolase (beta-lactamase superfamily II)